MRRERDPLRYYNIYSCIYNVANKYIHILLKHSFIHSFQYYYEFLRCVWDLSQSGYILLLFCLLSSCVCFSLRVLRGRCRRLVGRVKISSTSLQPKLPKDVLPHDGHCVTLALSCFPDSLVKLMSFPCQLTQKRMTDRQRFRNIQHNFLCLTQFPLILRL